jgi:hypothetical protein
MDTEVADFLVFCRVERLRHAFSKLGISSRVELARVVRDYEIA